jgi:hypothetical protein
LGPWPHGESFRPGFRSEYLEIYGSTSALGEVRGSADWPDVPREEKVRAVALRDEGLVVRWATGEGLAALGAATHEYLAFRGDQLGEARSGYVLVTRKDRVIPM